MIRAVAVLITLLVAGNAVSEAMDLPVPGAALGLVALAAIFAIRGGPDEGLAELFDFAAPYFPMLFVPAAVEVVASLDLLAFAWVHVLVAIVFGTAATILATGLAAQALLRGFARKAGP